MESEELYNLYHTIQEIHEKFWENIMVSEAVAAFEENLLPQLIEKKFGISQKDFLDLGANFYLGESIVQKYQRSLSELKQSKNSEKFDRLLSDHIKNFYWIRSGFHGYEELTPEIVNNEIRDIKDENMPRAKEIKKNIPREAKDWLEFLSLMAHWKDEKKRIGMQANYWIFKICEEIAMKKAAAIVTDEGGITSHAAIVSRELGKPCIIGTKIATKIFKEGELIEVNANHNWVRKVK